MSQSLREQVLSSWRGVSIGRRPALLHTMAGRFGVTDEAVDADGRMLAACLYCTRTERCIDFLDRGEPASAAYEFCPNARRLRAAASITGEPV